MKVLVVGQDAAVEKVVEAWQLHSAGLAPMQKPIGSFLFLGPTGTGKTRLVEALAQCLVHDPSAVLKVDCAEFQHGHEIAKLVGSPPGYLGHRETSPMLSQEALNSRHTQDCKISFVLFDEIEKASDTMHKLLLGILDKATMTLGDNRRVDFSQSMIFMTSNLGAKEMGEVFAPGFGFAQKGTSAAVGTAGVAAAKRKFSPEFMNRLDAVVVFNPLSAGHLGQILELELDACRERIMTSAVRDLNNPRVLLEVSEDAKAHLITVGTDVKYGARYLKRAIERHLMHPIVNLMSSKQIVDGDTLSVTYANGKLGFFRQAK